MIDYKKMTNEELVQAFFNNLLRMDNSLFDEFINATNELEIRVKKNIINFADINKDGLLFARGAITLLKLWLVDKTSGDIFKKLYKIEDNKKSVKTRGD
jgi:hypothetical protein